MVKAFLILHVLAAILAIGPVAVAASRFPGAARRAGADEHARAELPALHRICRVYALVGIAVPFFGFGTAGALHVMGSPWVIASIALTALAAAVLALLVLPGQRAVLAGLAPQPVLASSGGTAVAGPVRVAAPGRLAMYAGVFNLLWAAVTVLMILRPGSTTGG